MPSKELIEKVAAVLDEGIKSYQTLDVITEDILSTILAALQEPTEAMCKAADNAGAKAWRTGEHMATAMVKAAINASPLGEQSE